MKGAAILGLGALGGPAALALARSGVPRLGLFDGDRVELSNLPRQLLYREQDVGRPKAEAAALALRRLVPGCEVVPVTAFAGPALAPELSRWPVWIDGTDALATKLWLSDLALALGRTLVHGGAAGFSGQALLVVPGAGPCVRCLVEEASQAESCRERGILGPVAGVVGAAQARLAWSALRATAIPGTFVRYDAQRGLLRESVVARRRGCGCGASSAHRAARVPAPGQRSRISPTRPPEPREPGADRRHDEVPPALFTGRRREAFETRAEDGRRNDDRRGVPMCAAGVGGEPPPQVVVGGAIPTLRRRGSGRGSSRTVNKAGSRR